MIKNLLIAALMTLICLCWSVCGLAATDLEARNYSNRVPDTLDLVQHAGCTMNALTGTVDEQGELIVFFNTSPPSTARDGFSFASSGPKYAESLAMMSVITGADLKSGSSRKIIDYLLSCLGEDGLLYSRIGPDRPWDKSSPEDWANMYGQGRMLRSMLALYQLDRNPAWVARMKKLVGTLERIAFRRKDPATGETYAYYPTTSGYGDIFSYPKSGWKEADLKTGAQETMADLPDHSFGIPLYIGGMIEPLVRYAKMFDDKAALELAGELMRFVLKKESAWMPDGHSLGVIPEQNGQFYGHFHGHTLCLRGILQYGIATNNMKIKNFARSGYEYARTYGIPRIGWFPEYTGKYSHETCGLANMIALAIKLSTSGVGDYWDDVDCYARNHLVQTQFTDLERFKTANNGQITADQMAILKRVVGTFAGWGTPNSLADGRIMNCCTANGSQALYYVWDSIVRYGDGAASVNLLMNRRSPWVDIESALPDAGEVVLRNKTCRVINVRIPSWVDKTAVKLALDGRSVQPVWAGNYIALGGLKPKAVIRLTFPVEESTERYSIDSYEVRGTKHLGRYDYTIRFKGNTAVGIDPAATVGYPVYSVRHSFDREILHSASIGQKRIDW